MRAGGAEVGAWSEDIEEIQSRVETCVRVTLIEANGSTPRAAGAAMLVFATEQLGTIGGGALEFDAARHARRLLDAAAAAPMWVRDVKSYPLGPTLGQCCGGHVRLLFERLGARECDHVSGLLSKGATLLSRPVVTGVPLDSADERAAAAMVREGSAPCNLYSVGKEDWLVERANPLTFAIHLYGAGHVARSLVQIMAGTGAQIVWVDTDVARFPEEIPAHANRLVATAPHAAVEHAPADAFHLVMTCSHALDLDICHAVLRRGAFSYLGLIGSRTKRERFVRRLLELGVAPEVLDRMTCPIGADGPSGKEPAVIAIAAASEILRARDALRAP